MNRRFVVVGAPRRRATEMITREVKQPWILYHYGRTHDGWWPIWNSTRLLGWGCIVCACCLCGDTTPVWFRIPRFGPVPVNLGYHAKRIEYLKAHLHGRKPDWTLEEVLFGTREIDKAEGAGG